MNFTSDTPVRQIVLEIPTAIPVFESFGIDYCCGGKSTLAAACAKRGLAAAPVLEELERQQQKTSGNETDWGKAPLQELAEYIVERHHAFTRQQLDLVRQLAAKVGMRHGDLHPEVLEVREACAVIAADLTHHFFCEENILFPYISQLEAGDTPVLPPVFGSVDQPVSRMIMEHEQTGDELRRIRELTGNYQPPADACTTYRALYRALEDLERDLHQHIHLENNILFPRALEAARERV
ncbi:MAG TPA: iron-sulfur cluster repair di-iron protein [Acidobacteriaceae bacterium]|nr:iron-sulfur cluster repair di-iron protein [Acidobacteriaceae bacterium]